MPTRVIRIISDLHFGDRASRIPKLTALTPLLDGADEIILNGDTIDTRPSRTPQFTADLRASTLGFFKGAGPTPTFLTGNHDPDIGPQHTADLAEGRVFVTHGDIIFDDLVPWGRDAPVIKQKLINELALLPAELRSDLQAQLGAYRRVAISIPQRHQSEKNGLKYLAGFLADTVWPPTRILRVLDAWQRAPKLAANLTRQHRRDARFAIIGHIHRPGVWKMPDGMVVMNTGAFCPPAKAAVVEISHDSVSMRPVQERNGEFRLAAPTAQFPL